MQLLRGHGAAWDGAGAGAREAAPFAAAVAGLGLVFGGLAAAAGLTPAAAVAMSATTFGGSAQFAAVAVLASGGSALAAAGAAALLNARYLGMVAAATGSMPRRGWRRFLLAQCVVDESWAVAYRGDGRFSVPRLMGAALVLWSVHVGATAVGVAAAGLMPDPRRWGLDAALAPLLVLLLWPHLAARDARDAALLGAVMALALAPSVPPGLAVLGAGVAVLLAPEAR